MNKYQKLKVEITGFKPDIRAEVLVADLLEKHFVAHEVMTHHVGNFLRSVRKDIEDVAFRENTLPDEAEEIVLELSRDGIYDSLPEGLFHQPSLRSRSSKRDDIMDQLKKHREEEKFARKYFSPFENEFFQLKVLLEKRERNAIQGFTIRANNKLLKRMWRVTHKLTPLQTNLLVHYLPLAHLLRGDNDKIEKILKSFFGVDVTLSYEMASYPVRYINPVALREMTLGIDSILGDHFTLSVPILQISIGPIARKNIEPFLPLGQAHKILHLIQDFFLPAHVYTRIKFLIARQDNKFTLSDSANVSYLGFNTYI